MTRKITSHKYNETHVLAAAFCDNARECSARYSIGVSPTQWAQEHTRDTGHATVVKHELSWSELITKVEDEDE